MSPAIPDRRSAAVCILIFAGAIMSCDSRPPVRRGGSKPGVDRYGDPLPEGVVMRLGTVRLRHGGAVWAITFSPDGKRIASGGMDDRIRIWDATTGRGILCIEGLVDEGGPAACVKALAFSPDGARLASTSLDHTVRMWDAASGEELWKVEKRPSKARRVAFSPDGSRLATGWGSKICIRDARTGKELVVFEAHESYVYSLDFSPDGKRLVSSGGKRLGGVFVGAEAATTADDETVRVWDAETGTKMLSPGKHSLWSHAVAWSPDGVAVASGDSGGWVRVWDARTGASAWTRRAHSLGEEEEVLTLAYSPDGRLLASGGEDGRIRLWDSGSGRERFTIDVGGGGRVESLAFSPDARILASGGGCVRLWDAETGEEHLRREAHTCLVRSISVSPDGRVVATASQDGTVRLWDLATGRTTRTVEAHEQAATCAVFDSSGERLATSSLDGTARLWDAANGEELVCFRTGKHEMWSASFTPSGRHVVTGSGFMPGAISVWDPKTGHLVWEAAIYEGSVLSLAFSPRGELLASGGADNILRLWRLGEGGALELLTSHGHKSVGIDSSDVNDIAFFPDGETLAYATGAWGGSVVVYDVEKKKAVVEFRQEDIAPDAVAVSPDGRLVASGVGYDGAINIWDATAKRKVRTLTGHFGRVYALAFTPDGRYLVSGAGDATALVWDATAFASRVCRRKSHRPSLPPRD